MGSGSRYGPGDVHLAVPLDAVARCYRDAGQPAKQKEFAEQALAILDLDYCDSLADESKDLARRLLQCNEKIRDGPSGSPERFHMTTYDFAATILFGSSSRYGAGAAAASGQVGGGGDGGGGGGVGGANDEAKNDGPPRRRPRAAASEGCILGKINELGEDGGASDFKKNMADFCGVSFKGAFEGWAQELKEKFGLVRGSGSGSEIGIGE